jgi:EmrB/QacA subfamily drug resistance transporter
MTTTEERPDASAAEFIPSAQLTHREILIVLSALMAGMLLAALDQTVLSTALPTIVGELSGLERLSWVVTSYLLTSTVSVPLYGKLSDLYGRKHLFQLAIGIFVVGSLLSGLAQTMTMLIVFRGVQGLGAGGIQSMAQAIIADIVSPRERGRYVGYMTGTWALSSIAGPLLGGLFVDHLTWRWLFYMNVPIGIMALVVAVRVLKLPSVHIPAKIDYTGAALIVGASSSLLLALTWGGTQYAWDSATIVCLFVAALVGLVAFVFVELRASEPMLPLRLFKDRIYTVCNIIGLISGMSMFGALAFMPLYLQVVRGVSATSSGLRTLPMILSLLVTVIWTGQRISKTGKYRMYPIMGTFMLVIGLGLLSQLSEDSSWGMIWIALACLGVGIGLIMQVITLAVQNSVQTRDMGTATASVNFFRSMGGAMGVALFGAVLSNRLTGYLDRYVPAGAETGFKGGHLNVSPAQLRALAPDVHHAVERAFSLAVTDVFMAAVPLAFIAFITSWFLKEVPLRRTVHREDGAEVPPTPIGID